MARGGGGGSRGGGSSFGGSRGGGGRSSGGRGSSFGGVPSAAAKALVVAVAKEEVDLLEAAGLISPVLPVQAVRFSGVATLSEAHLLAVPIILVVALEVLRAAV